MNRRGAVDFESEIRKVQAAVVKLKQAKLSPSEARLVLAAGERAAVGLRSQERELHSTSAKSKRSDSQEDALRRCSRQLLELDGAIASLRTALRHATAPRQTKRYGEEDEDDKDAATSDAIKALLRTRASLAAEVQKVEGSVARLQQDGASLKNIHGGLSEVDANLGKTAKLLRKLGRVQTVDDIILRATIVVYGLVVLCVLSSRVFGFFPSVSYRQGTPAECGLA